MTFKIAEGDEIYDIEATDFVKIRALEDGFPQDLGEIVRKDKEATLPGTIFANGKPSWVQILGVFGGKVEEKVVLDASKKKAPKRAAV